MMANTTIGLLFPKEEKQPRKPKGQTEEKSDK